MTGKAMTVPFEKALLIKASLTVLVLLHHPFDKQHWEGWITMDPFLTPLPEVNSKWTKDINTAPDAVQKSWRTAQGQLLDCLDVTAKAQATEATINAWDHIKLKSPAQPREPPPR